MANMPVLVQSAFQLAPCIPYQSTQNHRLTPAHLTSHRRPGAIRPKRLTVRRRNPFCIPRSTLESTTPFHPSIAADTEPLAQQQGSLLSRAKIISVTLPLNVYLEQAVDGRVFVDEVMEEHREVNSTPLQEGDVIAAVSLPFTDGLVPVPTTGGLDMIESQIDTREGQFFNLAILPSEGAELLRRQIVQEEENRRPFEEIRKITSQIHSAEPPYLSSSDPEDDDDASDDGFGLNLEALRKYGFDLGDDFSLPSQAKKKPHLDT